MRKIFFLLVTVLVISGCGTLEPVADFRPLTEVINLPPENEVKAVELGASIIQKYKIYKYPYLELQNELSGHSLGTSFLFAYPGKYPAKKQNEKYLYFYPESGFKSIFIGWTLGLRVSKTDSSDVSLFCDYFGNGLFYIAPPSQKAIYQIKEITQQGQDSFQQEFIYSGKQGNYVKFLYREVINNLMRSPFTQEVQYDLNESKIIGFKGARVEIIEATNTSLKYKVIKSFSGSM